jgi:hypothetical protein
MIFAFAFLAGWINAAAAAPPPTPPCSLLTQAQVDAALGVSAKPGTGSAKICNWAEPTGSPGRKKSVVLTIQDAKAFDFAKSPTTSPNIVKTPASGIGDDAVYVTVTNVTTTLTVKKGDAYFELHVYGLGDTDTKAAEKTLALDVIAKLQ